MRSKRSIATRRRGRHAAPDGELQITSMLDILIVILIFLLMSYSASTTNFQSISGMEMPTSRSPDVPTDSPHLIITPEAMILENQRVVEFIQSPDAIGTDQPTYSFNPQDLDENGHRIVALFDALVKVREQAELRAAQSSARDPEGNPIPYDGLLAIQADKRITYDTLRKVMYTAAAAEFKIFRFLAKKKYAEANTATQ